MNSPNLPFNWFDLVAAGVLIVGVIAGRKKGMSEELLPLLQWLAIVVVSALYYEPVGNFVARFTNMGLLSAYLLTYLASVAGHIFAFNWLKRFVGEKLVASDIFGRMEYYLGMLAGALRFACVLLVGLAVLNARHVAPEQLAAERKMQRENFGSISFPTLGVAQEFIFRQSATGRLVKAYLDQQLIAPTPPNARLVERTGLGKRRERAVNEVLNPR